MNTQKNRDNVKDKILIPSVTNDGTGESYFSERAIELHGDENRRLSEQQSALNFRLRTSDENYASDWHVAGDPTLLVILQGSILIELRNGQKQKKPLRDCKITSSLKD